MGIPVQPLPDYQDGAEKVRISHSYTDYAKLCQLFAEILKKVFIVIRSTCTDKCK